jgi:hypothetical protein
MLEKEEFYILVSETSFHNYIRERVFKIFGIFEGKGPMRG